MVSIVVTSPSVALLIPRNFQARYLSCTASTEEKDYCCREEFASFQVDLGVLSNLSQGFVA
jgi:hypothetical protein